MFVKMYLLFCIVLISSSDHLEQTTQVEYRSNIFVLCKTYKDMCMLTEKYAHSYYSAFGKAMMSTVFHPSTATILFFVLVVILTMRNRFNKNTSTLLIVS